MLPFSVLIEPLGDRFRRRLVGVALQDFDDFAELLHGGSVAHQSVLFCG